MSERTDQIINDHLQQRPAAWYAYEHDQFFHTQVEMARSLLSVMESAMQREGVPYDSAGRVLDEVMGVCLSDWEREKARRERELLLADIDPSPWVKRVQREQEMDALWDMNRAALDRSAERLSDDTMPERLVSSEEKTT